MKIRIAALLSSAALASLAFAAKPWDGMYTAFRGKYMMYSGDLGEEAAPTPTDRKTAIVLEGEVAMKLFAAIGPDIKDTCGTSSGLRVREKGDLNCTYDKDDRATSYTCHFGIDLRTGRSMRGSIC